VIHSIKFISSANVPIIKLVADLQVICAQQDEKLINKKTE